MPQRAHRALIPLAAFLAILPILIHGPSCGHDFDFHLLSWLEASTQFAHFGFPHWAYTPAYNAGEPRFIFYPPISWTLGGLLGLIVPWQFVPAAFTWIALTLSGFTAHRLASRYAGPTAALFAATIYLANPYMLFTAYERTAYAELLAAAFLPLLFQAALGNSTNPGAPCLASETWDWTTSTLAIAIPIALLWLTNAPAAVMACYALAVLTFIRLMLLPVMPRLRSQLLGTPRLQPWLLRPAQNRALALGVCSPIPSPELRLALTTTAGLLLGLTLAAFYILPAAWERKYVQVDLATTTGMRPADHFLFHRMSLNTPGFTPTDIAFHDTVVRTASLVALTLLAAIALAFLISKRSASMRKITSSRYPEAPASRYPEASVSGLSPAREAGLQPLGYDFSSLSQTIPLATLTLLIAFLLTPPSAFLWHLLPQLRFLQFPWRLCALLAVILCVLAAKALNRRAPLSVSIGVNLLAGSALAAALIFPAWHLFHQPCDQDDNIKSRVALFHSNLGTEPTDEYTPADADPDALHPHNPPYWLEPSSAPVDTPAPPSSQPGQAPQHLALTIPVPETLILNRRQYPGWQILLNQNPAPLLDRTDGLIAIPLPAGNDTIDLTFAETPDRLTGLALSAAALTLLITLKLKQSP